LVLHTAYDLKVIRRASLIMNTSDFYDDFSGRSDCYATLGVEPDADAAEIEWAYRAQAQHYRRYLHDPDPAIAWEAEVKLNELDAAYLILGNPLRRQLYDRWHHTQRQGPKWRTVSTRVYEADTEDDFSAHASNFSFISTAGGLRWLSALRHALPRPPAGGTRCMGPLAKMLLLPIPFCLATMVSALFWHLGAITGQQFLGDLTAILAYPLILFASLVRLLLPIRYRPLLSTRQKLLWTPIMVIFALVLGWLWFVSVDHEGTAMNPLDLYWWCGLLIAICASLAYS
jgi:hypothetical protein